MMETNEYNPYHREHSYYDIWQSWYEAGVKQREREISDKLITSAYTDGWLCWETGGLLKDNPHSPDTMLHRMWDEGYEGAGEQNL
jgi:hypothetical protein